MRPCSKTGILHRVGKQGDFSRGSTSWRDQAVGGGGVLLLAVSFRPWWGRRFTYGFGSGAHDWEANAWSASSLWSLAILLGLLAVGLWFSDRPTLGWCRRGRELAVTCLLVAIGASMWQVYRANEPLDCSKGCERTGTLLLNSASETAEESLVSAVGGIQRNRLFARSGTPFSAGLRSGFYQGVAILTAMGLTIGSSLVRPGQREARRPPNNPAPL